MFEWCGFWGVVLEHEIDVFGAKHDVFAVDCGDVEHAEVEADVFDVGGDFGCGVELEVGDFDEISFGQGGHGECVFAGDFFGDA